VAWRADAEEEVFRGADCVRFKAGRGGRADHLRGEGKLVHTFEQTDIVHTGEALHGGDVTAAALECVGEPVSRAKHAVKLLAWMGTATEQLVSWRCELPNPSRAVRAQVTPWNQERRCRSVGRRECTHAEVVCRLGRGRRVCGNKAECARGMSGQVREEKDRIRLAVAEDYGLIRICNDAYRIVRCMRSLDKAMR
jgi:hypothetical protein